MNHSIGNWGDSIKLIGLHLSMVESVPICLCTNHAQNAITSFDVFEALGKIVYEESMKESNFMHDLNISEFFAFFTIFMTI